MLLPRRLYHCTRCLYTESSNGVNLPPPSNPEPVGRSSFPSIPPYDSRVRLSPDSLRKVSPVSWERAPHLSYSGPQPFGRDPSREEWNAMRKKLFKESQETLSDKILRGQHSSIPIAGPHAVHCVIWNIPYSFLASDVKRLVPHDPTKERHHPLVEVKRIYGTNLSFRPSYLLRFSTRYHLNEFLHKVTQIKVFGRNLEARIFHKDQDPKTIRPRTLLAKNVNPESLMNPRNQFFRESRGTLVMIEGIPRSTTLGNITYTMQVEHRDERFEWAYEWANIPGEGHKFEPNAVPTRMGYHSSQMSLTANRNIETSNSFWRRWVFMLKDRENAWRFARHLNRSWFREATLGKTAFIKAIVLD